MTFRERLHEIIFEADTPEGRAFDIVLIWSIIMSVGLVILDSVSWISERFGTELYIAEWAFTILFTFELLLRLYAIGKPFRYLFSFYGLVDILAIIPTYLSILLPGAQSLLVIRVFRLLRVFRVFKLVTHLGEAQLLMSALKASRAKITVFLLTVSAIVVTMGTIMYVVEGEENGFTSIPTAIYWAIVTMTTVGFGDITPKTPFGQFLASCLMITGYGIIAVPTGIVTTEIARATSRPLKVSGQACKACGQEGHDPDARYCKHCGAGL